MQPIAEPVMRPHELIPGYCDTPGDIAALLDTSDPQTVERFRSAAERVTAGVFGREVYLRGLIEFSNICRCDCLYCGIRASNRQKRYQLTKDEIVSAARWCAEAGYGSVVLQSGERNNPAFVAFVESVVREIVRPAANRPPDGGLTVTLCAGEQTESTYRRWFEAGARRYLLRIETSSPQLFARIHPAHQTFESRVAALRLLRRIGYQVGSGVMMGLPGQTSLDCARDLLFLRDLDVDMIGMGPYIPHGSTPLAAHPVAPAAKRLDLGLRMIALARLLMPTVNIASTTALQALVPHGREQGLRFGANVIMPQVSPLRVRRHYQLYDGKPCVDESSEACRNCIMARILGTGRIPALRQAGDSVRARQRACAVKPSGFCLANLRY